MAHNNAPHEGLPNQLSPREVHFTRAPRSFLRAIPEVDSNAPPSIRSTIAAARAVREDVVRNDVMAHVKRQEKRSPTNYTARIQKGDYALQKRTSFPTRVPKKLAFRMLIDAYEVKARIATNSYRVTSTHGRESCSSWRSPHQSSRSHTRRSHRTLRRNGKNLRAKRVPERRQSDACRRQRSGRKHERRFNPSTRTETNFLSHPSKCA